MKELPQASPEEEMTAVPLSDLEHLFSGSRAERRKFLSNLRRLAKKEGIKPQRKIARA